MLDDTEKVASWQDGTIGGWEGGGAALCVVWYSAAVVYEQIRVETSEAVAVAGSALFQNTFMPFVFIFRWQDDSIYVVRSSSKVS